MKMIGLRAKGQQTWWMTMLLSTGFLCSAGAGETTSPDESCQNHAAASLRIVNQYGSEAFSGQRAVGSNIFDVTVGPKGNELRFVPDSVNIVVGDTVRWTWGSNSHSVTSGTSCTEDDQFCSPNNMNCEAGILNNTGFVYEFTFTQSGIYQYFCHLHCFVGMTGVVNVRTTHPMPRPRPTPAPRP